MNDKVNFMFQYVSDVAMIVLKSFCILYES